MDVLERLVLPKEGGGMRIRDTAKWNLGLLAKLPCQLHSIWVSSL